MCPSSARPVCFCWVTTDLSCLSLRFTSQINYSKKKKYFFCNHCFYLKKKLYNLIKIKYNLYQNLIMGLNFDVVIEILISRLFLYLMTTVSLLEVTFHKCKHRIIFIIKYWLLQNIGSSKWLQCKDIFGWEFNFLQ